MKKACFFIGVSGGAGSVAGHFAALGTELIGRGHDVKIITHSSASSGDVGGQNPSDLVWPSTRPTRLTDALFLARLIRQHRPDCLLANFAAVNWMCLVGWLHRVRHRLAFYHTLRSQTQTDALGTPGRLKSFSHYRKKLVYRTATCIAGISRAALLDARHAYGLPARKCTLWRYSMPDPAGRFELKPAAEREDIIVCAGRLFPSKGQDVLISALALLSGSAAKARVEFLGVGPMLESLRRQAEQQGVADRCRFVGLVSHSDVLARMSRAKVTVVPSRHEAFGLVNIESLSVGTPVIASAVDGISEIVQDGVNGFLVPADDPPALAQQLSRLLSNESLREQVGRDARKHFLEHYENTRVVGRQADWLEKIVQSPGRPATYES